MKALVLFVDKGGRSKTDDGGRMCGKFAGMVAGWAQAQHVGQGTNDGIILFLRRSE